MGYADRIGNALPRPTVGDLEKARLARQIEAEKIRRETPTLAALLGDRLAAWIADGGAPPWEKPGDAGSPHTYPETPSQASAI